MKSTVTALYLSARTNLPEGSVITILHIIERETLIASGAGDQPAHFLILPVGARTLAESCLAHNPPTPGELENAIEVVEDALMLGLREAGTNLAAGGTLYCNDIAIREIASMAGLLQNGGAVLGVGTVEDLFGQLAAVSQGRPASSSGIKTDGMFAATLLILREIMQHLHFAKLNVTQ